MAYSMKLTDAMPPAEPIKDISPLEITKEKIEKDDPAKDLLLGQRQLISMVVERELLKANVIKAAMSNDVSFVTSENRKKQLDIAKQQMDSVVEETNKLKQKLGKLRDQPCFHISVQTDDLEIQCGDENSTDCEINETEEDAQSEPQVKLTKDLPKLLFAAGAVGVGVAVYKWFF